MNLFWNAECESKTLLIAVLLSATCVGANMPALAHRATSHTPAMAATARQVEDAAIYALLITTQIKHDKSKPFVVEKEAVHGKRLQDIMQAPLLKTVLRNQEWRQALQDCRQRGRHSILIPSFSANRPLLFASSARINRNIHADYWKHFYREFPNAQGVISFALPGYASDGQTALAFMEWHSSGLSGEGLYLLLTKETGQWKIKKTLGGWEN